MGMMLGWSSLAAVLASCWNRRTTWSSWATSGGSTLIATSRSSVKSCARKTWPIPPLPSKRSSRYLPSMMRCSRSRTMSTLLVLVSASPPDTSAPHDRQNLLLPGIGVWQRKHSTTGLVIGASCPRSEERRVGKEGRARGGTHDEKERGVDNIGDKEGERRAG